MRLARVIEKPEDLATVFADAQTSVTYDSATGRFYYPSLGLYFDPVTSLFYDPKTGQYRDQALQGEYYEDCMSGMYYDPLSGYYFDAKKKMPYDPISGAYSDMESGLSLYWDSQLQMFYDPMHDGKYYDRGLGLYLTYDQQKEMFCTEDGKYYDPELCLYYDEEVGLFFDPLQNRYYDKETGEYRDPDTGSITPDAPGHLHLDDATGYYFCDLDGHYYWFDSSMGLYCSIDAPMDGSCLYYDADTTHHIVRNSWMGYYYEVESGNTYDPMTRLYYDGYNQIYYRYEATTGFYVDDCWGMRYVPYWLSQTMSGSTSASSIDMPINQIDLTSRDRMFFDMMQQCWTNGCGYYYDERTDIVFFFDPTTYCYYDIETGNSYLTPTEATSRQIVHVDVSAMSWDDMCRMYYDSNSGRWYDDRVGLYYDGMSYYDPATGDSYWYDSMANRYVNSMTGEIWMPNSSSSTDGSEGVDLSNMYYDSMYGMYYDPYNCRWYDDTTGLYYDGMCYFDLKTGDTYWYDMMWDQYFNSRTGEAWVPKTSPSGTGSNGVDMSNMYWDDMYRMYYDWSKGYYYDDKAGLYYDGMNYYDPQTWDCYWYDSMMNRYVNYMTGATWVPPASTSTNNGVDMSNMYWDDMYRMYYDWSKGYYYDDKAGLYYDGMNYYDPQTWDCYWYDSMMNQYINWMTGEAWTSKSSSGAGNAKGFNLANMVYDEMYGMYYDPSKGYYFDASVNLYYDGMSSYYDPQTWRMYYYDSMQDFFYDPMTGERYIPRDPVTGLTQDEIDEIKNSFLLLGELMPYANMEDPWDTMTDPINKTVSLEGTYYAAPFGAADAVWFDQLLADGMNCQARRIRLRASAIPLQLEVEVSDPWSMMPDMFQPANLFVEVSESVWNRATRSVVLTLEPAWCMGGLWNGNGMYYWTMMPMTGIEGVDSQDDFAAYARYAGDGYYENLFSMAVFRGCWSFDCSGMGMMMGGSDCGLPMSSLRTVGGLQDTDGDGLADVDEYRYGTNIFLYDTDGDGLNDALEIRIGSCPTMYDPDSDGDGMADVWEEHFGFNPQNPVDANADPDKDSLINRDECFLGTNPIDDDTDADGLRDGQELKCGTQPCNPDTDNDGLPDGTEVCRCTNPLNPDTDLDGLPDGREVGLGLDPLCVDTDNDGIADSDEVEYQLLGMSVAEKESSEIAWRLRNWLPTGIEDIQSDIDNDGIPDWVEYLGGGEPGEEFDVFEGTDGFPSVYVMTVNVEVKNLVRPLMLECNGEKVCVNRSCSIQRFCEEGTWHNLRVVGVQGASVKVNVDYDDPRYSQALVVTEDPQKLTEASRLPNDSFLDQHVVRELKFCQPTVEIVNEHICFHGTGMNPQMKKTVTAKIVPEGFSGEFTWWTGANEELSEDDVVEGQDVNVFRENVGSQLFCSVRFMMDMRLDGAFRVTQMPITECTRKDKDAQQAEWCNIHNCEVRCCREKNILDCTEMGMNFFTVNDLPKSKVYGGIGGTEIITSDGFESENEEGRPYYANKYARYSIPVNSDDDNGNGIEDFNETGYPVLDEDDLRRIPLAPDHGECCICHKSNGQVEVTEIGKGIRLWMDENKTDEVGNWPYSIHTKVYVEGMAPSSEPDDATISCVADSDDPNEEVENILHQFTIYSLRLLPDLNKDNLINLKDAKLVHDMKELGLGWCLSPRVPSVLRLNVDVNMPGDVTLIVRGTGGQGTIRVYTSDPYSELKKECLHSLDKDNLTEVAGNGYAVKKLNAGDIPDSAANFMWVEVSDPGVSGSIEVVYEGSGIAEGYECHAKIRFQSLDFQIAGDGGVRDGKIDFKDPNDTNIVFWVNDDYDVLHNNLEEDMWQEDDDDKLLNYRRNCDDDVIGAIQGKDSLNQNSALDNYQASPKTIYCLRDLEDFDRLHLKLGKQLLALKNRFVCEVRLDPLDEPEAENPAINLFPALASDQFYLMKNDKDINDEHVIEEQMKTKRLATADSNERWQMLDISKCHREKAGECERVCFLYEGKESGMGFLTVRVKIGNVVLASTSLRMDLHPASTFIDTYEIEESNETNQPDIDEMKLKVGPIRKIPAAITLPGTTDQDRVVLTLGWNVKPFEKKAWRDTVFKRLFWQGYRGRVATLMWPTTYNFDVKFKSLVTMNGFDAEGFETTVRSLADASNYDRGDHRAWLSGVRAADYFSGEIQNLNHVTFLVHSQGNVLMGEMLRRLRPEIKEKITYIALQGAASAQLYTRNFMPKDKYSSFNLTAFGISGALDWAGRWLNSATGTDSPDIFGHYPYGRKSDPPYLDNVLNGLWHTANFYNRNDYALNIWLGNNGTKPDNLKGVRRNDRSFGFTTGELFGCLEDADTPYELFSPGDKKTGWKLEDQYGRFYQNRDIGRKTLGLLPKSDKVAIYPGNRENSTEDGDEYSLFDNKDTPSSDSGAAPAKWCVFSFVTQSRSLAIGQLPMMPYFNDSVDLHNYGFGSDHYFHSQEFRSNCRDMWMLWSKIHEHITASKESNRKESNK